MRRRAALALLLGAAACGGSTVDPPVLDATGTVAGVVFLDVDGDGTLTAPDVGVAGISVRARSPNGERNLATVVTEADGAFRLENVPVGSILAEVDPDLLGDSVEVLAAAPLTVEADETVFAPIGVSFPTYDVSDLRGLPAGMAVFTSGVVLNGTGEAPGGAVHIESGGRALRILPLADQTVEVGDSVRVQGRTGSDLGQTVLRDARIFRIDPLSRAVTPDAVTAAAARTADVGRLDADLVALTSGEVMGVDGTGEGDRLSIRDQTGTVEVRLRADQGFAGGVEVGSTVVRLVGLLVHDPVQREWTLVPRTSPDVTLEAPVDPPDQRGDEDDKKGKKGKGD
jgi:hypothetical protein